MSTQLLIVPFPPTKNKSKATDSAINNAFGGSAPNLVQLSQKVKSANPDKQAFQQYIPQLGALMNAKVPTSYTSPFTISETFDSDDGATEILNTLWNYLSFLQNQMVAIDSSNQDYLREFKPLIEDAIACVDNMREICKEYSHPFFTSLVCEYAHAYNNYCIAIWQIAIIQTSNKGQNFVARQALTAVDAIKEAERCARQFPDSIRSYFLPIATSTLAFYQAFVYYQLGSYYMNNHKAGLGCQCYASGVRYINRADARIDFAPILANSITFMKRAVTTSKSLAEDENRKTYLEVVHDGDPDLPKPLPLQKMNANKALHISLFFAETQALLDDDPFADIPSGPPGSGGPSGGIPQQPAQPTQPQQPFIQPPVLDDPWASNTVPQAPQPQVPQPQAPQAPEIDPFPVWDIVLTMKKQCTERAQKLLQNPRAAQEANTLLQQMTQAASSDQAIQAMIDQFKAGSPNLNQQQIEGNVQQAMQYYSSVEAKLTKLESA